MTDDQRQEGPPREWKIVSIPGDELSSRIDIIDSMETKTVHDTNPDYDCYCERCAPRTRVIEHSAYLEKCEELDRLKYVPGHLECKKCNFYLVKNTIYVKSGTIGANNEPDDCANGCGPMWRVTWIDHSKSLGESCNKLALERNELKEQLEAAQKEIAELKAPVPKAHKSPYKLLYERYLELEEKWAVEVSRANFLKEQFETERARVKELEDKLSNQTCGYCDFDRSLSKERDQLAKENEELKASKVRIQKQLLGENEIHMGRITRLRSALEKYPCVCGSSLPDVLEKYPHLVCHRCKALKQDGGENG